MVDKPLDSWRARAAVSEALDVFNSSYMQDVWSKALARRQSDPDAAVTSARTLLETICKYILDSANREFREGAPLPQLYAETAKVLEMAPSQHLAPIFNSLFTACSEVITSIGRLRNELSDSHGRGPFGTMPDWRHAELAVNLSGAMATYLAAVWKGRQPTVYDVVQLYLSKRPESDYDRVPPSHYDLERIARSPLLKDLVATKVTANDLVTYFEERAAEGRLKPASVLRLFGQLRAALGGKSSAAFRDAAEMLKRRKLMSVGNPAIQRVSQKDLDALISYLREQAASPRERKAKTKGTAAGMVDVVEFAVWSGRKLAEILKLKWAGVDYQKKTCKLPGSKESFPVFGAAWEIIERRRAHPVGIDGRIFPYDRENISVRHVTAVKALSDEGKIEGSLRFHDYRFEAAHRLLELGIPAEQVARATGQPPARIFGIAHAQGAAGSGDAQGEDILAQTSVTTD